MDKPEPKKRPPSVQAAFDIFHERPETGPHATAIFQYVLGLEATLAETQELLRNVRDNGLTYWEPHTYRGDLAKEKMLQRIDAALKGDA